MADPMMYSEEMFVFLTPDAAETFMTPPELVEKLKSVLANHPGALSQELQKFTNPDEQAQHLMATHCEFETAPGEAVQWYAVRLEK